MRYIFYFFTFISMAGAAQEADTALRVIREAELELQALQDKAFRSRREAERVAGNKEFLSVWDRIVPNPAILRHTFKNLHDVSILETADRQLKLITWNLHRDDGTHAYFGYLLVNSRKRVKKGFLRHEYIDTYDYFKLIDRSAAVNSPETYIGRADKWFGMLYTQLIPCDGYYTLLGYDLNDKLTRRKFVDVLYFRNGIPVFGKDVFRFPRKNPKRLMFEYSSEVTMSLKYDEKGNRIIYSQLGPNKQGSLLEGQPQFYGPNGEFNALEMKKSKWVTIENIEANSDIKEFPKSKKPNPKKQKPVYSPK